MFKRVLLSTLLGGLLAYAWLMISWMVLPYHGKTIHKFDDETFVVSAIKASAKQSGVYHYPYMGADIPTQSKEDAQNQNDEVMDKMAEGPTILVAYSTEGAGMTMKMLYGAGSQFLGAFFVSLMMLFLARSHYMARLMFVSLFAVAVGVLASSPLYVWWQFDQQFVLYEFLDYVIGWTLAGVVMAAVMKRQERE